MRLLMAVGMAKSGFMERSESPEAVRRLFERFPVQVPIRSSAMKRVGAVTESITSFGSSGAVCSVHFAGDDAEEAWATGSRTIARCSCLGALAAGRRIDRAIWVPDEDHEAMRDLVRAPAAGEGGSCRRSPDVARVPVAARAQVFRADELTRCTGVGWESRAFSSPHQQFVLCRRHSPHRRGTGRRETLRDARRGASGKDQGHWRGRRRPDYGQRYRRLAAAGKSAAESDHGHSPRTGRLRLGREPAGPIGLKAARWRRHRNREA